MNNNIQNIAVVGAGTYGTVLASIIAENNKNSNIRLWSFEKSVSVQINSSRRNSKYLPDFIIPNNIYATSNIKKAVENCDYVILAVPSRHCENVISNMQSYIKTNSNLIISVKGFTKYKNEYMPVSLAASIVLPNVNISILSGPNHIDGLISKKNTVLVYADKDKSNYETVINLISNQNIYIKKSDDIIGVELGGVLKNPATVLYAIYEKAFPNSDNFRGVLLNLLIKDIEEFIVSFNGLNDSAFIESGIGDLFSTCLSQNSRNKQFGFEVYKRICEQNKTKNIFVRLFRFFFPKRFTNSEIAVSYIAEGAYSIKPLIKIADKKKLSVPAFRLLYEILKSKIKPDNIESYILKNTPDYLGSKKIIAKSDNKKSFIRNLFKNFNK